MHDNAKATLNQMNKQQSTVNKQQQQSKVNKQQQQSTVKTPATGPTQPKHSSTADQTSLQQIQTQAQLNNFDESVIVTQQSLNNSFISDMKEDSNLLSMNNFE